MRKNQSKNSKNAKYSQIEQMEESTSHNNLGHRSACSVKMYFQWKETKSAIRRPPSIVESKTLGRPQNTGIVALFGALVQNLLRRFQILNFTVLGIPESVRSV